jgi:hypothetical protein
MAAPALHSLNICFREDAACLLLILFNRHINIRRLRLVGYWDNPDFLIKSVALFPQLESLTLEAIDPEFPDTAYSAIPHLKKLSELTLYYCSVRCVYVYLLETHRVCKCEHV